MIRKVINWKEPGVDKRYEIFLECMHTMICHTDIDPFPPHVVDCQACGKPDNLERKGERIEL